MTQSIDAGTNTEDAKRVVRVSADQRGREEALTRLVLDAFAKTESPRLRQLLTALVRHLHAYAREVRLTEAEWNSAIQFLTDAGHITTDKRQEFILLSDVLGLSIETITINNDAHGDATEATLLGPVLRPRRPAHRQRRGHVLRCGGKTAVGGGQHPGYERQWR